MRYIYFYLHQFFRCAPRKDDASRWAAAFAPAFFLANGLTAVFTFQAISGTHYNVVHWGAVVAVAFGSSLCSFFYYELGKKGESAVASLNGTMFDRNSALIGGLIFFETIFCPLIPAAIAVVNNPHPQIK
jgi:hypothetical protein